MRVDADRKVADFDAALLANATALAVFPQFGSHDGHDVVVDAIVGGKVVHYDLHGTHALPDLVDATLLAPGCAVRAQGSVVCWGDNAGGMAGQPTTIGRYRRPPSKVLGVGNVAQIAMNDDEAWACTQDGKLFHWGKRALGWATEVPLPSGVGAATALAVDVMGDACVIGDGGAVWCSVDGVVTRKLDKGAISIAWVPRGVMVLRADGSFVPIELHEKKDWQDGDPPALAPAPGAVELKTFSYRQCVRFGDGGAACFEGNEWSRVPNLKGATDFTARYKPCAVRGGALACWSYDNPKPLAKPEPGPAVSDAVAVVGGDNIMCVVRARGRVTCFHDHDPAGQDMIPTGAIDVEVPINNATGCAIMRDRTVQCWGKNDSGVLGDGSVTYTDRPLGVRL